MRITFFTFNAYEMLIGGNGGDAVGGAQLQQILIGSELAQRGHEVFFVEYEAEYKRERTIDGISIVTIPRPSGSSPSRAFSATTSILRVIRRTDPDVCFRRVLDFGILPLSIACSLSERRFVYNIAHDDELTSNPHMFSEGIKSTSPYLWANRLALSNADAVIAQNDHQRQLAESVLNTNVYSIPNCYSSDHAEPISWEHSSPIIFWAARFQPWKQPKLVAKLASELPEVTFVMAGGPGDETLFNTLKRRGKEQDNLEVLGHVPFAEIDRYFSAADIFLNTSDAEGFPNTFLQAWAQQTPIVSLQVDPNDILSSNEIGFVADGSFSRLQDKISQLTGDSDEVAELGRAGYEYLRQHHTIEAITDRYEDLFSGDNT